MKNTIIIDVKTKYAADALINAAHLAAKNGNTNEALTSVTPKIAMSRKTEKLFMSIPEANVVAKSLEIYSKTTKCRWSAIFARKLASAIRFKTAAACKAAKLETNRNSEVVRAAVRKCDYCYSEAWNYLDDTRCECVPNEITSYANMLMINYADMDMINDNLAKMESIVEKMRTDRTVVTEANAQSIVEQYERDLEEILTLRREVCDECYAAKNKLAELKAEEIRKEEEEEMEEMYDMYEMTIAI